MSYFFYKRKLTLYNLTAQTSTKPGYFAIWTELTSGRASNEIASAFVAILNKVVEDHPSVTDIACWFDISVPQNRNSHISQAILELLWKHAEINSILLQYSMVGHSCVQLVDCMHKQIEDDLRVTELYSTISFLKLLIKVNRKKPYRVIQLGQSNFKNYMNASKLLQFSLIPYTKVYQHKLTNDDLHCVQYKLSHGNDSFEEVCWKKGNYTTKEYQTESDANSISATGRENYRSTKTNSR